MRIVTDGVLRSAASCKGGLGEEGSLSSSSLSQPNTKVVWGEGTKSRKMAPKMGNERSLRGLQTGCWPKLGPCRLIWCPVGGLVGGCGAQAVSRKTPIYFIYFMNFITLMELNFFTGSLFLSVHCLLLLQYPTTTTTAAPHAQTAKHLSEFWSCC